MGLVEKRACVRAQRRDGHCGERAQVGQLQQRLPVAGGPRMHVAVEKYGVVVVQPLGTAIELCAMAAQRHVEARA